jgi:hypothetical protein
MARLVKKSITDTTLPDDLVSLLQQRGFGGKRVYVPAKDRGPQLHDKLAKLLEEVESVYEATGLRFFGGRKEMASWDAKFSTRAISVAQSISMRSAQRLRPVAMALWKRFFRNTEIPIIRRLENLAAAYQLDYMEVNLFYRRERAMVRKNVAHASPWYGSTFPSDMVAEIQECLTQSLAKRPWSPKNAGPQLLNIQGENEFNPTGAGLESGNDDEMDLVGL